MGPLSNASGPSAPATITFNVIERPDPSQEPEVIGLLHAQVDSARRLAANQIQNLNDRLEQLHDEGDRRSNSMGVQFVLPQDQENEPLAYVPEQMQGNLAAIESGFPTGNSVPKHGYVVG